MPTTPKFLVFAGSTRTDSFNKKLAHLAEKTLRSYQADATYLDLRDLPMPLYDGDLEAAEGIPENAMKFRALLQSHHAFVIASPEYNSSFSAVLKNAIDWASRPIKGEPPLVCFAGKFASLLSASPGKLGGLRGLVPLRSLLGNISVIVLPEQLCIGSADTAFTPEGNLSDQGLQKSLEKLCENAVRIVGKQVS